VIGILGGTFDPIHFGHLRLAQELAEKLSLSAVRFIPSAQPPHRAAPHAEAASRVAMVNLAIEGNPLFSLDLREIQRPGPSYMFDTLTSLRAELGKNTPLCLMLGADAFLGLPNWHRWRELFGLAHIVLAHRPGFTLESNSPSVPQELRQEWHNRHTTDAASIASTPNGCILMQETTALDISASAIRALIASGGNPRYLLLDTVIDYIHQHHLYTQTSPKGTA